MAKLQSLIRRASTYLNFYNNKCVNASLSDGEIVFCKNNVCVHSSDNERRETVHHLGYLTINVHHNHSQTKSDDRKWTLILKWTPNDAIRRNSKNFESMCLNDTAIVGRDSLDCGIDCSNDCSNGNSWRSLQSLTISTLNDVNVTDCDTASLTFDNYKSSHKYDQVLDANSILINNLMPSSIKLVQRSQSCGTTPLRSVSTKGSIASFNVDLNQMKSLRLFFSAESDFEAYTESANGQLVIVSRDNHYKVFHFHYGGIDKLVNVLSEWNLFDKTISKDEDNNYLQFSINKPQLNLEECHPEEGVYNTVNETEWKAYLNELGVIENEANLKKSIFFAGIEPSLRKQIWPFLVQRFQFSSTHNERLIDSQHKNQRYLHISQTLESMGENERQIFWRNVESIVEKDVVRTDRCKPFFAGDNNDNILKMKRILLNYALYCPSIGYTQGMSDLLAPLLTEIECESETFWCFVAMLQFTNFVCPPKDADIDHNLALLRELLRLMYPSFYSHIKQLSNDLELLFAHRWILLCFKREFNECDALHIWEACWANYQTNYFHLFVCLSIISIYGKDVVRYAMGCDEILFHFSTLSMHMNGNLILRKARGLFYHFTALSKIPCTLAKLKNCSRIDMWDSDDEQRVECIKDLPNIGHLCSCDQIIHSIHDFQ